MPIPGGRPETGGHMILPLPGAIDIKPAKAMVPFFGVVPALMDEEGKEITGPGKGSLCIKNAWPGMLQKRVRQPGTSSRKTTFHSSPGTTSRATEPSGMRTAIIRSPAESTTSSTFPDTEWEQPKSKLHSPCIRTSPNQRLWDSPRYQRPGNLCLCNAEQRC